MNRPIRFIVSDDRRGSARLRAVLIAEELRRRGRDAIALRNASDISGALVILVKRASLSLCSRLKKKKNVVVLDAIDPHIKFINMDTAFFRRASRILDAPLKEFDCILCVNSWVESALRKKYPNLCIHTILHPWDPACHVYDREDRFSLVHFGYSGIKLDIPGLKHVAFPDFCYDENKFREASQFTCHISVRSVDGSGEPDDHGKPSLRFFCKSNIKVSTAAAFEANIICTRDPGATDVLPESYPFFVDAERQSIPEFVEYVRSAYGTKIWREALEQMRAVRERTSLRRICDEYEEFFRKL